MLVIQLYLQCFYMNPVSAFDSRTCYAYLLVRWTPLLLQYRFCLKPKITKMSSKNQMMSDLFFKVPSFWLLTLIRKNMTTTSYFCFQYNITLPIHKQEYHATSHDLPFRMHRGTKSIALLFMGTTLYPYQHIAQYRTRTPATKVHSRVPSSTWTCRHSHPSTTHRHDSRAHRGR